MLCPWALRLGENAAPGIESVSARRVRVERGWHSVVRDGMALWATSLAVDWREPHFTLTLAPFISKTHPSVPDSARKPLLGTP